MANTRLCSIPDCGNFASVRGWCPKHYWRWRKHGDPLVKAHAGLDAQKYFREVVLPYEGNDCLMWPFKRRTDGRCQIMHEGKKKIVSRLVCEIVNGGPPTPRHEAAHSCGNGHLGCVTKGHLSWKTHAENMADMVKHAASAVGERHGSSKLTAKEVREIRAMTGMLSQRALAARYAVSSSVICEIQNRRAWRHVP